MFSARSCRHCFEIRPSPFSPRMAWLSCPSNGAGFSRTPLTGTQLEGPAGIGQVYGGEVVGLDEILPGLKPGRSKQVGGGIQREGVRALKLFIYPEARAGKGQGGGRKARDKTRLHPLTQLDRQRTAYYYGNWDRSDSSPRPGPNRPLALLGISPVVGRLTLAQEAEVRTLHPQPTAPENMSGCKYGTCKQLFHRDLHQIS